jgi:hypothetical protein
MPTPAEAASTARIRLRCWGTDDPAVVIALSYENQPARTRRQATIGRRAAAAGWPEETKTTNPSQAARTHAYRSRRPDTTTHRLYPGAPDA